MIEQESQLTPQSIAMLDQNKCASEKSIDVPQNFDWTQKQIYIFLVKTARLF